MVSTASDRTSRAADVRIPSVLVVLVTRDGARWLRDSLQSLSAQTHPRLGVIAVDNGSTDESRDLLERALGSSRVISLADETGLAGAVRAVTELPVAQEADYLLFLHDDTALAPDAVARLVDAAEGIEGLERVGVVGPKVVDWERPRILRDVGRSTDRFGHPYTPLQDGEMDHGQYDRVLEVLFVSSCAMLVSRAAWQRTGLPDERFESHHEDLDFCWRARLAGFRVLMTPLAQASHRDASARGERRERERHRSSRYFAERAALASMLKNYGVLSLLWLLPLYAVLGVARLALLTVSRRFEDAFELLAAWGWNLAHLPGTIRRRIRAQSVRAVPDRKVRRFMESAALRLPRWFEAAGRIMAEQRGLDAEEEAYPLRARASSLARTHPALVAWALAIVVAALGYRRLIGPGVIEGGVLGVFPAEPGGFFGELVSAVRTTGLGGSQVGSPALAALGAVSAASLGNAALAQKICLGLLPPAAGLLMYRSLVRQTGLRLAAVVGAACYALSAIALWAFSQGRIDLLVALAVLPAALDRLDVAFGPNPPWKPWRFAVGAGVAVAIALAFFPGVLPALGVMVVVHLVASRGRGRGLALTALSSVIGAILVFPIVPDLVSGGGLSLTSYVGQADFELLARLSPGPAPGSWAVAWFLPAAAVISFGLVGRDQRGRAYRAVLAAVACLFLAWASAAGHLPDALTNAPAYVALAAASEAAIVAYGLAALVSMGRQAFGYRQIAAAALTGLLVGGLGLQALEAARGDWEIGPNRLAPAWPIVASGTPGEFRVLWLGRATGLPFPAPGGDPQGILEAGSGSLRYSITDREGATALDIGRGFYGGGYTYTERVLTELLSGTTRNAGALLAPLAVRFIVAATGDLQDSIVAELDAQLDLNLVPAGGLVIFRNAAALPPAASVPSQDYLSAARRTDLLSAASLPPAQAAPLREIPGGWAGTSKGGVALLADQHTSGWRMSAGGDESPSFEAFGWATGFPLPASGEFEITYTLQWIRTVEAIVLGLLWLAALWITRKPVAA